MADGTDESSNKNSRQTLRACYIQAAGLCVHFFGYECARAASIALISQKESGLGNDALPLTIAIGTPLSGLTLYLYTKSIKKYGSAVTLRISMIGCILLLGLISVYPMVCENPWSSTMGKWLIILFYSFREIYVSLLSTQQWAFIATNLNKSTSSYLVSFTGLVSIASAIGGGFVEHVVNVGGVQSLILSAFIACILTYICSEVACYQLGDTMISSHSYNMFRNIQSFSSLGKVFNRKNNSTDSSNNLSSLFSSGSSDNLITGCNRSDSVSSDGNGALMPEGSPRRRPRRKQPIYKAPSLNLISSLYQAIINFMEKKKSSGFWYESYHLVRKHHILRLLFFEAITHQCCTNMLNLMFHNGLRKEIEEDSVRAMLVGRFFATVNISACILQCFVLPHIMSHASLPTVLLNLPIIVLIAVLLGVYYPGIISVMIGFGTIKVLEYSVMTAASEMIYMPMSHDVRYLGKELIKFFGHKLGKSAASLVLSYFISYLNPSLSTQSVWGMVFSGFWAITMYQLSQYLVERGVTHGTYPAARGDG